MGRKPWLWLLLATPCAFAIWWFALGEIRRVQRLADHPERVSTSAALRRAGSELRWVVLSDARFDCEHSMLIGEYRYGIAQAPGIPPDTTLILPALDGLCPKPGTLHSGAIERIEAGRQQRALAERGVHASSLWELSVVREPSDARAGAGLLLFVGACVQFLGFFGYLKRKADTRVQVRRSPPLARELLLRQLASAPLKLRRSFIFSEFFAPVALQVFCLGMGVLMIWLPVTTFGELRAERARWDRASEVQTLGPPAVMLERKLLMTPLLAYVHMTWRDAKVPETKASAKYHVLWYAGVEPPYRVKHDALGTLTSVGVSLTLERAGSDLFVLLMGIGFLIGSAYYAHKLARRQLAFRAVTAFPRPMFRRLEKTEILRHNGIATGQIAYTFLAPSGESITQTLAKPRAPVFDLDETGVLVVTAFDAPAAEPILVADDGYPFETRAS